MIDLQLYNQEKRLLDYINNELNKNIKKVNNKLSAIELKSTKTVLIIDDSTAINNFIRTFLISEFGFNCEQIYNGKEALEAILKNQDRYGLLTIDIEMPIMSGEQLLKELYDRQISIPKIVVTGSVRFMADKEWAIDYLGKLNVMRVLFKPDFFNEMNLFLREYFEI